MKKCESSLAQYISLLIRVHSDAVKLFTVGCVLGFSGAANSVSVGDATTDQLIIRYKVDAPGDVRQADFVMFRAAHETANRRGLQLSYHRTTARGSRVFRMDKPMRESDLQAIADQIQAADPNVASVEPDRVAQPLWVPNDSYYSLTQWYLTELGGGIRVPLAWDRGRGLGVTVAVVDSGVRPHQDLSPNLLPGYDFIATVSRANDGNGRDADASDPGDAVLANECGSGEPAASSSWHGTVVSGLLAAAANNGNYIAGVAPLARVVPVRVLGKCGGYNSDIADGIAWAAGAAIAGIPTNANPARVINLSLGGPAAVCPLELQGAVDTARFLGAVVVAGAGNKNVNVQDTAPANCAGVLAVAATTRAGARAPYSNYGDLVRLSAPGGDGPTNLNNNIRSTSNTGISAPAVDTLTNGVWGTSLATPLVAGTAALILSVNPNLAVSEVEQLLISGARPFPGACAGCGSGIVDANTSTTAAIGARKFYVELIGDTGTVATWRVKNTGTVAVNLQELLTSPTSGAWNISGSNCAAGSVVPPGASCTVTTNNGWTCMPSEPYFLVAKSSMGTSQAAQPAYSQNLNCGS